MAIGASGGKDSTVLASVLGTLNKRHDYGLNLCLLSVDEGITGYRDDSLETVKRNAVQYDMPLRIIGYKELYGWTMDEVVDQVGKKGNCTYCGVFRRQALDRGAEALGVKHVVTGHNADDIAETVLMNCKWTGSQKAVRARLDVVETDGAPFPVLRGDLPRLARATSILTASAASPIKRSKPLKYAYEKEIVLYAHHKKLDYFSTECIYSPEAFRGSARALIKSLERIRPSAILDVVRSGEDMAKCVPMEAGGPDPKALAIVGSAYQEDNADGCGSNKTIEKGTEMLAMEKRLAQEEASAMLGLEVEITTKDVQDRRPNGASTLSGSQPDTSADIEAVTRRRPLKPKAKSAARTIAKKVVKQQMGQCERCGYLSSQAVCKACMLLEGLNRNRPRTAIALENREGLSLAAGINNIALSASGG